MNDVGCILVNFNSGALCVSAVHSLLAQRFVGADGGDGTLQIVVVDNASPIDQHPFLDPLVSLGVDVVYHDANEGYGGGANLGLARIDAEFLLVANPDILVLDGALAALVTLLRENPDIGGAGPRGFLDHEQFILLPPNDLPTLSLHVWESLGRAHPRVAERAALERSRRYMKAWRAAEPFDVAMISGFAMFLRARLAHRLGPFDAQFPFYFEDADLCRRVRRAGYRLVLEPRARMIHFFDQSARMVRAEVQRKYAVSRAYYYEKHYGAAGLRLYHSMNSYASKHGAAHEGWRFHAADDLGDIAEPMVLDLGPGEREHVMEIGTDPSFLFCGGHLGAGAELAISMSAWDVLEATRWYLRVLDARDLSILRYVTFRKVSAPREPISFAEYEDRRLTHEKAS